MVSTHHTDFQENLEKCLDMVCDTREALFVQRASGRNVIVLSEKSYNNILENMYILGDRDYYESLLRAKQQIETGEGEVHDLIEAAGE